MTSKKQVEPLSKDSLKKAIKTFKKMAKQDFNVLNKGLKTQKHVMVVNPEMEPCARFMIYMIDKRKVINKKYVQAYLDWQSRTLDKYEATYWHKLGKFLRLI